MSRIKIIHILHSVGGVDTSLRMIINNIDPSKFENIVIHGRKDNTDFYDRDNNKVKEYFLPIEREISFIKDLKSIFKAKKIIKAEKPSIIHAHSAKGGVIGNVLGFFFRSIPILHTPQAYSFLSAESPFKRKIFVLIERLVKGRNSYLLASSESELERGVKEIKYTKDKTLLFNNCIEPIKLNPEFKDLSSYNLPDDFICTVGRPSYQKNIEMMIESLKLVRDQIPNIHLVIMGIGVVSPNTENVKALIKKYGLEKNTTLINWTERERIFHIVSKAKFYLSTARYEGLPYAIIEALSLSKAIIATNCDGNRDLITENYNGHLVNENDHVNFAAKIISLFESKENRTTFEKNSYQLFNDRFNLNKNITNLEGIYHQLA